MQVLASRQGWLLIHAETETGDSNYEAGSTTFDLIVNEAGRPHGRPAFLCKTPMEYQSQNNAVVSRFVRRSFGKTTPLF